MIFGIIPIFLLFCLYKAGCIRNGCSVDIFKALSFAACLWAVILFALTELLSLFSALEKTGVSTAWILTDALLLLLTVLSMRRGGYSPSELFGIEKRYLTAFKKMSAGFKAAYILTALAFAAVLVLSRITVPYNWDSMTYHLTRIMMWAQGHSVAHFAAEDSRQLSSPYLAEFVNLHLYALKGNDLCFNLLQGLSYCFNSVMVYGIAVKLKLDRRFCILASVLFMSAPISFAEALTTQVDQFAAVWMVTFVYVCIDLWERESISLSDKTALSDIMLLGISLGLGYMTKPSVCIAMVIFAAGLFINRVMKKDGPFVLFGAPVIVGITALILTLPEVIRNILTFGSVSTGNVGAQQLVGTMSPGYLIVNFVKNLCFNLPNVLITRSSELFYRIAINTAEALKVDINDKSISEMGAEYAMNAASDVGHDTAINAIIVSFFLIALIAALAGLIISRRNVFDTYCVCAALSYPVFLVVLRWEPYETRYQISYFALLAPLIAAVFYRLLKPGGRSALCGIIAFLCVMSFLNLWSVHFDKYRSDVGIRPAGYFAVNRILSGWESVTSLVNLKGYKTLGIKTDSRYYSYPVWRLCGKVQRIENVITGKSASKKYEDPSFRPEALIWIGEWEEDTDVTKWHDEQYRTIFANGEYRVLEASDHGQEETILTGSDADRDGGGYIMLEEDAGAYFDMLKEKDLTVFVSADGICANMLSQELKDALYSLGLGCDLSSPDADSLFAVIEGGEILREEAAGEPYGTQGEFDCGHKYTIISAGSDFEGYTSIQLDGFEFAKGGDGLKIVAYDNEMDQVVDSVCIMESPEGVVIKR